MKSYTDIEQSKKLAEILRMEGADMWYWEFPTAPTYNDYGYPMFHRGEDIHNVPCWSLAALLEEIPEIINFEDDESDYELKIEKENGLYYLSYGNILEYGKIEIEPQENFVDACYEMIIKLDEQKLL